MRRLGAIALVVVAQLACSNAERVTVPNLHHKCVVEAYEQLRKLGLKVEIDGPISVASNQCSGVDGQAPEAGKTLDAGSEVTLHPGFGLLGSIFSVKETDSVVVPDLIGSSLDVAIRRLDGLDLLWTVRPAPPLPTSDAPTLLENYVVTRTHPGPGQPHDQYSRTGNASTFRPMTLWVKLDE